MSRRCKSCNWLYTWWISLDCMDFSSDNWLEFHSVTPYRWQWMAVVCNFLGLSMMDSLKGYFYSMQYILYRNIFLSAWFGEPQNSRQLYPRPHLTLPLRFLCCDRAQVGSLWFRSIKGFASQLIIVVALSHTATLTRRRSCHTHAIVLLYHQRLVHSK